MTVEEKAECISRLLNGIIYSLYASCLLLGGVEFVAFDQFTDQLLDFRLRLFSGGHHISMVQGFAADPGAQVGHQGEAEATHAHVICGNDLEDGGHAHQISTDRS